MGVFRMPSLGADMEAGTLVEWLKKPGDEVHSGDIIAVVETQKGAIEIEVFEDGVLQSLLTKPGSTIPVGTEMAIITGTKDSKIPEHPITQEVATTSTTIAPTPLATPPSDQQAASPAARRFAAEHGLDLSGIEGSGPNGAIVFVDVENALRQRHPARVLSEKIGPAKTPKDALSPMRKAIGAAMSRSKREIPHYYLGQSVDATTTLEWLEQRNASRKPEERVLFPAMLLKAVALALGRYPEFNGFNGPDGFRPAKDINIGMAVAQRDGGLVAPAIHDVEKLDLDQIMAALREVANRVRAGRLRASELSDPTFTVTSLGDRGPDWVLPVIYPPQVAILGAGPPAERPWVVDGQIRARRVIQLTLAADHRVSDGHRGGLFLRDIARHLETPEQP